MRFLIHYDAVAVFLNLVAIYIFATRKNLRDPASARFTLLLCAALGSSVFGLLGSLAVNASAGRALITGLNAAFLLFHNAIPILTALYILAILGSSPSRWPARLAFVLPGAVSLALILSNPFSSLAFGFDASGAFQDGPGLPFLYASAFSYIAWSFFEYLRRRKKLSASVRLIFPTVLGLPALAIIAEGWVPNAPLESFAVSIALLLILFTNQNSGAYMDRSSGLLNAEAFRRLMEPRFRAAEGFELILVRGRNLARLRLQLAAADLDLLLAQVAAFLSARIGSGGRAFCLGEGSFVLMPAQGIQKEGATEILDSLVERLSREWKIDGKAASFHARFCLLRCPQEASDALDVYDCLEQMATRSLEAGRRSALSAAELGVLGVRREAEIEGAILEAIATNRVGVSWQALHSVEAGRFTLVDTHIYLEGADKKPIQQRELLRASERSGTAHRLGFLALKTVCSAYASLDMAGRGIESVQVRLSAFQCLRSDLPQQILAITESLGMDPSRLCLEITEETVTQSPDAVALNMRLLSAQGVSFALDDYGSGYTDLGYILDLPFNLIKLDKGVLRSGFASDRGRIVMESTIALLRRLNRKIAAEGVETAEQAQALADVGVDYLQGFHYARPMDAQALADLLGPSETTAGRSIIA